MKNSKPFVFYAVLLFAITAVFVTVGSDALAQASKKILIYPFQIHAKEDLSFLKKGIAGMLSSRLAQEGKVEIVQTSPAEQMAGGPKSVSDAIVQGKKVGADYVIFGSLTLFGESVSTDVVLVDLVQQKPVITFSRFGESHDDAIAHVNRFAAQVNEQVFGRKPLADQTAAPQETVSYSRRHPEKIYEESGGAVSDYAYDRPGEQRVRDFAIWRSRNYDMHIRGIAVGDVDGDKLNETVVISDDTVAIFRYENGGFQKLTEIKAASHHELATVDVADINANGLAEIFVTAEDRERVRTASYISKQLRSFVLEWSDGEFKRIADNQKWYYRVVHAPGRQDILLGQQRGFQQLFSGKVRVMGWQSGSYAPLESRRLPQNINVYSVNFGDVTNDRKQMIVGFTPSDYLKLYTENGEQEWESSKQMGGSNVYFEYPEEGQTKDNLYPDEPEQQSYYIAQRIILADMDKDGKIEVIVGNNRDSFGRVFSKVRSFRSGHVECLFWDTLGLYPKWKTRTVSGYLSDYFVADFDNDGAEELLFAVDTNTNPLTQRKARSYLVSWKPKKAPAGNKK